MELTDADNEVLAKFAGFHWGWWHNVKTIQYEEGWRCPNNKPVIFEIGRNGELPDLLHSLDSQAKWLWPRVREQFNIPDILFALVIAIYGNGSEAAEACGAAILALVKEQNND